MTEATTTGPKGTPPADRFALSCVWCRTVVAMEGQPVRQGFASWTGACPSCGRGFYVDAPNLAPTAEARQ